MTEEDEIAIALDGWEFTVVDGAPLLTIPLPNGKYIKLSLPISATVHICERLMECVDQAVNEN